MTMSNPDKKALRAAKKAEKARRKEEKYYLASQWKLMARKLGKHKLAPLVSPKKTVEGSVCGALASIPVGALLSMLPFMTGVGFQLGVFTALVSSSLGQVGDLAESLIKRMIGIKDFSDLIPGHGGIFDRVDSLLFAIPAAFVCLYIGGVT